MKYLKYHVVGLVLNSLIQWLRILRFNVTSHEKSSIIINLVLHRTSQRLMLTLLISTRTLRMSEQQVCFLAASDKSLAKFRAAQLTFDRKWKVELTSSC